MHLMENGPIFRSIFSKINIFSDSVFHHLQMVEYQIELGEIEFYRILVSIIHRLAIFNSCTEIQ